MHCSSYVTPQQVACTSYAHCHGSHRAWHTVLFYPKVRIEANCCKVHAQNQQMHKSIVRYVRKNIYVGV